jgi:hypothetical protein
MNDSFRLMQDIRKHLKENIDEATGKMGPIMKVAGAILREVKEKSPDGTYEAKLKIAKELINNNKDKYRKML